MNHSTKQILTILSVVAFIILLFALINPFKTTVDVNLNDPQIDYFIQGEASSKVDVLWVIDNSGSMESSQDNLADNFSAFINQLVSRNSEEVIDFHIAVVTTDLKDKGRFVKNKILRKADMLENKSKFIGEFQNLVRVGISGAGIETDLMSMLLATRQEENRPFFRKDAILVVNIVSDEPDMSVYFEDNLIDMEGTGKLAQSISNLLSNIDEELGDKSYETILEILGVTPPPEDMRNEPVLYFVKEIKNFKKGRRVMINSIVNTRQSSEYDIQGKQQMKASEMTNGLIADIYGNFASTLANWGNNISSLASSFAISRLPDTEERMQVFVDGYQVDWEDWQFNEGQQNIEFINGYVPEPGSEIEVQYEVFNEYSEYEN
ncbi:MAG: VWA domain-containing protein [Bacteroidetes bacterium]|nr:VWA domain-containing protein [Bacteroidota bacterium]